MAKTACRLAALVVGMVVLASSVSVAQTRVRTDNPELAAVIAAAVERSETFRRIVEAIDASDGLVFVQEGRCGHSVRACLALSVTQAGPHRLLRVIVDTQKADWDLMGSLGHELHHALEVLGDPTVNTSAAAYLFYRRAGETSGDRFETPAAIVAGNTVRQEARRSVSNR